MKVLCNASCVLYLVLYGQFGEMGDQFGPLDQRLLLGLVSELELSGHVIANVWKTSAMLNYI